MNSIIERAFQAHRRQADLLSFRLSEESSQQYECRDGRPESLSSHQDRGLMMEVAVDGVLAYGATSDLSPEGIKACFEKTKSWARALKPLRLHSFEPQSRGHQKAQSYRHGEIPLKQVSARDVLQFQSELSAQLKAGPHVVSATALTWLMEVKSWYLTSDGGELEQSFEMVIKDQRLTAAKGSEVQTRSDKGYYANSSQMGAEAFSPAAQERDRAQAELLIQQVNELLDAEECPEGNLDLVLAPDQMMLQIHESIGHPLELDRILGDERNYAGWSFVRPEDFGQLQYGSSLMNVSFDPSLRGELAGYDFDDAGTPAEKVFLIKNGVLLAGLGSRESQLRSGLQGVANSRAQSWNRAPIDRMANLNLEPGDSSLEDMIASVERGVYMETNRSWSIDDERNKFQFGCEYARRIEDGRLTSVVKNPNYRGQTVPFWNSLKALGNPSTFEVYGTPHCGKGEPNQVIRVGHASPACLFAEVEVFGGAS